MSMFDVQQQIENEMLSNAKDVANLPVGRVGLYSASVQGDMYNQGLMSLAGLMGGSPDPRIAKEQALQSIIEEFPDIKTSAEAMDAANKLFDGGFTEYAQKMIETATSMRNSEANITNANKVTGTSTDPNIALKRQKEIDAANWVGKQASVNGYKDTLENQEKQLEEMKRQGWLNTDAYEALLKEVTEDKDNNIAREKSINDDVKVIGDRWVKVGIPDSERSIARMEELILKYTGADGSGNLPGINIAEQAKGNFLGSEADAEVIQALAAIENALLKERSGAAVTESEYTRFLKEVQAGFRDDAAVIRFIKSLRAAVELEKSAITGAFRPEVRNRYWQQSGWYKTYQNVEDTVDLAVGTYYFSPDGKLRQKGAK